MPFWEYKHITSGPHGFATPALLEAYLNQLGKDEWEILTYQTLGNNSLAFNGIARRTTVRDWTLESAAAAAAKIEADKLRAEFAAKFQGQTTAPAEPTDKPTSLIAESAAAEDGLRKLRNTERDHDPEAEDDEAEDWDNWDNYDDDLPTLFEAIKPHLRKNQRGPGQSAGLGFLAKRWEQPEADLVNAFKECGFTVPTAEDTPPDYVEFEGDLYWLNLNNRNELFINTREKPRPVFRLAKTRRLDPADPVNTLLAEEAAEEAAERARRETERVAREAERLAREAEAAARRAERDAQRAEAAARREAEAAASGVGVTGTFSDVPAPAQVAPGQTEGEPASSSLDTSTAPATTTNGAAASLPSAASLTASPAPADSRRALPQGEALLAALRPQMRRNRRGPGYSGSTTYLARALRQKEDDLIAALVALGLVVPATPNDKPLHTEIGSYVYWLNKDSRGGLWINGQENTRGERQRPGADSLGASGQPGQPASSTNGDPVTPPPASDSAVATPSGDPAASTSVGDTAANTPPLERTAPAATHNTATGSIDPAGPAGASGAEGSGATHESANASVPAPTDAAPPTDATPSPSDNTPASSHDTQLQPIPFVPVATAVVAADPFPAPLPSGAENLAATVSPLAEVLLPTPHAATELGAAPASVAPAADSPAPLGTPDAQPTTLPAPSQPHPDAGQFDLSAPPLSTPASAATPAAGTAFDGNLTPAQANTFAVATPAVVNTNYAHPGESTPANPSQETAPAPTITRAEPSATSAEASPAPLPPANDENPAEQSEQTAELEALDGPENFEPAENPETAENAENTENEEPSTGDTAEHFAANDDPTLTVAAETVASPVDKLRPHLQANKRGPGSAAELADIAAILGQSPTALLNLLLGLGLNAPEYPDDKPATLTHAGEIYWLSRNFKDDSLSLNVKPARVTRRPATGTRPRSPAPRRRKPSE